MPTRIYTGRKLSKIERLQANAKDKKAIIKTLMDGTNQDGEFNGVLTAADLQRLGKLRIRAK